MKSFSLMYPDNEESISVTLNQEAINDLSVEYLCERITGEVFEQNIIKNIMIKIESNVNIIRYRNDIFEDLYNFPDLRERIKELLDELAYLKDLERSVKDATAAPVWQLINRLQELEIYIKCISGINESLSEHDIKSEGLMKLKEYVESVYNESGFEHLSQDISELVSEIGQIKSISLGVNLDNKLIPSEVGIVSLNSVPFTRLSFLGRFLDFAHKKNGISDEAGFHGMTKMHSEGKVSGEDPLMSNLSRVVTEMLEKNVKQLKNKLSRYTNISGYSLTKLIPEFIFYIRWADYVKKITSLGLPMCKPEISDIELREIHAEGIYNIKLAMQCVDGKNIDIVRNDIDFDASKRIYIMTGPNRGGKTTLTQAVGHILLLAQCGIYVPGEKISLSPADCIYTHFPADENKTVDHGRLGEESIRMSDIFSRATKYSLLLFNESLATTSFEEGLYIAKDVVRSLRFIGARTIFNTHMHELAMTADDVNAQISGDSDVVSLITGIHEGKRSYKIFIAPPEGVSYAQDIAKNTVLPLNSLLSTQKNKPPYKSTSPVSINYSVYGGISLCYPIIK